MLVGAALAALVLFNLDWMRHRRDDLASRPRAPADVRLKLNSNECKHCHAAVYAAWSTSDHAQAHRSIDAHADFAAFHPARTVTIDGASYDMRWDGGKPSFVESQPGHPADRYTAEFVMGFRPLRQYIVPVGHGHYQAAELAYDPARNEWFDVFGSEHRHPGEWGHWRGRGMNWNSMCAHCHLTDFNRRYDPATDCYSSTWLEQGVGCYQCHGTVTPEHLAPGYDAPTPGHPRVTTDPQRAMETCAPCHARNELLTGVLVPGGRYTDCYRVELPVHAETFYPDGQVRDEDFNYTSILLSRMGHAGVTCLNCHDPHSGKTIVPVETNALCLQCHGAPGPLHAPVIDPVAHSHHAAGTAGNRCVECHMPTTTYMQRDPRHDHGFLRPDPLLTKELGIPNACTRCHQDKSTDWEIEATNRWYGAAMESHQRARTRVVAAAQQGAPDAGARLADLLPSEDIPAWRATLLQLAAPHVGTDARLADSARAALRDPDPLVRSAAVQILTPLPDERDRLRPMLRDPSRLVRVDAEWALSPDLPADSEERRELDAYLAASADQPSGQLRLGQDLFNRGDAAAAEAPLRRAIAWDPDSPAANEAFGFVLDRLGRPAEAANALWNAAQLRSRDAVLACEAGLEFASAHRLAEAENALREAIHRNPEFDRAWYNLGLLLAQSDRPRDAIPVLQRAQALAPANADYPYALGTVLWRLGDRAAALAAARHALQIDPNYAPARNLLEQAR